MTTSAHELMRTVDCVFPGCPDEADKGSEVCADHRRWLAERHGPIETDDERLRRMFDEDEDGEVFASADDAFRFLRDGDLPSAMESTAITEREETRVETKTKCRTDGCVNESAGKGGGWTGYCQSCIHDEMKRRRRVRDGKQASALPAPAARPARANATPPVPPTQSAQTSDAHEMSELVDAVKAAEHEVEELELARTQAKLRLYQALRQLREHVDARIGEAA